MLVNLRFFCTSTGFRYCDPEGLCTLGIASLTCQNECMMVLCVSEHLKLPLKLGIRPICLFRADHKLIDLRMECLDLPSGRNLMSTPRSVQLRGFVREWFDLGSKRRVGITSFSDSFQVYTGSETLKSSQISSDTPET